MGFCALLRLTPHRVTFYPSTGVIKYNKKKKKIIITVYVLITKGTQLLLRSSLLV